jgi:hypothetical protein
LSLDAGRTICFPGTTRFPREFTSSTYKGLRGIEDRRLQISD